MRRYLYITAVIVIFAISLDLWNHRRTSNTLRDESSLLYASQHIKMLQVLRARYTSEVVAKASAAGLEIRHDYQQYDNAIPLPATFSMDIAQHVHAADNSFTPKLYSNHPFPWRSAEKDGFQKRALEALTKQPDIPYFEFISQGEKQKLLRYAVADLMLADCVNCHNGHEQSPKIDWQIGDVRGALEVTVNLDQVSATGARGDTETAILIITIMSLCALFFSFAHRRLHLESKSHLARFQAVFKSSVDAIVTIDNQGLINSFNPAAEKMFGYKQRHVLGKNITLLMPPAEKLQHDHYIHRYQKTGKKNIIGIGRETTGERKDGSHFPIELSVSQIEYGYEKGFAGIIRDISERKTLQQQLTKSEIQYRDLYDNAPTAYASVRLSDNTIVQFNKAFMQLSGYEATELEGMPASALYPDTPDGLEKAKQLKKQTELGEENKAFDIQIKRKDCSIRWASISCISASDNDGKVLEYRTTLTDITELKQAQLNAEMANQAKSKFLSSMSHELRTPLNAILGFAQVLEMNHQQPLTKQQKSSVAHIMEGGYHLLALVNDVLDLTKIEAGKVQFQLENLPVNPLLDQCIDMLQMKADEHHIQLIKLYSENKPITIKTDFTRFKQMILNLLSNAIKYNRENGQVTIDYQHKANGMLRIEIVDTGYGIPADRTHELFQPFSRLGAETTETEGHGIGLRLTKGLVEMMGGKIGIKSQQNKGTKVWLELPLN